GSQYPAVGHAISETEARRKVVLVGLNQALAERRIRRGEDLTIGGIQIRQLTASFIRPCRIVVSEPVIHRQSACRLPIVLEEERRHPQTPIRHVKVGKLRALRITEKEISPWNSRSRLSRKTTVEVPAAAKSGHIQKDIPHRQVKIDAKLQLMCTCTIAARIPLFELACLLNVR